MSSDNHASYARIGFVVFVGVCAIVASLIYLGGVRGRDYEMLVETYYDKPVSGLSVGSVVNFRGVKVGEVRDISFVGNRYTVASAKDNARIYILLAIDRRVIDARDTVEGVEEDFRTLIADRGLRATVTTSGITGLSRIEIDTNEGGEFKEVPPISWTPEHVCIPPKISLLDNFSVAATKVMNQINQMDLNAAWSNLNATIEASANAANSASVMINSRQADLERIIENLSAASEAARDLMQELRQNPSALLRGSHQAPLEETAR